MARDSWLTRYKANWSFTRVDIQGTLFLFSRVMFSFFLTLVLVVLTVIVSFLKLMMNYSAEGIIDFFTVLCTYIYSTVHLYTVYCALILLHCTILYCIVLHKCPGSVVYSSCLA